MNEIAKIFIIVGLVFIFLGAVFMLLGKFPYIGKLPGDILVKRDNFSFYFPMTTSIIVSIILSLLLFLINRR